ncbi:MAG TPA: hypothetical protein VF810_01970 [Patescibacteria group bacterium]
MPKKKKTREQKILADHRRETATASLYSIVPNSLTYQSKNPEPVKKTVAINTSAYSYLQTDLTKTALLTIAIIAIELIIRFFTK